eukprot:992481-Pyramimonas_sp.AAC.1
MALHRKAAQPPASKWTADHRRVVVARKPAGKKPPHHVIKRPGAAKQRKRAPFSLIRKRS